MTFELEVYLEKQPTISDIQDVLSSKSLKIKAEAANTDDAEEFCVFLNGQLIPAFTMFISLCVPELEALREKFPSISFDKITCQLNTSSSGASDTKLALTTAEVLVDKFGGVVIDPQSNISLYPRTVVAQRSKNYRSRLLTIRWLFERDASLSARVNGFFELLKFRFDFCSPSDPSSYTPSKTKLAKSAGKSVAENFSEDRDEHFAGTWKGRRPCLTGEFDNGFPQFGRTFSFERNCGCISLDFDSSVIEADKSICEEIVELFWRGAEELKCFYAAAYVTRNVVINDGLTFQDDETERLFFGKATLWSGIPDLRTWLAWFDCELGEQIQSSLDQSLLTQGKRLLRVGDVPRDQDQLKGQFPELPERLLNLDSGDWIRRPFNR